MEIKRVAFDNLESDQWKVRVIIYGSGFEVRGVPFAVAVGNEVAQHVMSLSENSLVAFLGNVPNDGDRLAVGYLDDPELSLTEFSFHTPDIS